MESAEMKDYWKGVHRRIGVHGRGDDVKHVEMARFICEQFRDELMYVDQIGWFKWTGRVWQSQADDAPAYQVVTDAAELLAKYGPSADDGIDWVVTTAGKMLVARERDYIVREMKHLSEFRAHVDDLDAKRHLLSFTNGTVDLRTGELKPHDPADLLTQCAKVKYDPDAKAPRWLRFVDEIFPNELELQLFYQTWLGMCITGETRDHALGVWYGEHGRNGKGTTIRALQACFGKDIVMDVAYAMFERSRGRNVHTEDIARMRNARMVVAQEGTQGAAMDTERLKNYSGGDGIQARHLYGKTFTFEPKFTLVLATNHLPEFATGGAALWARTYPILFGQSFADRVDVDLEPTLQGPEREGIASWVVEGAKRYYEARHIRRVTPLAVVAATEMHKEEVDPLKDLVGEIFQYDEHALTPTRDFNIALKEWRGDIGDNTNKYAPSAVKKHLLNSGKVTERRVNNRTVFVGIRLDSPPTTPQVSPGQMGASK